MLLIGLYTLFQVAFEIVMRDDDKSSFREIDTFDITATFPFNNQPKVFTGNRGIASITLTYDLFCIEPDACTTAVASSDIISTGKYICIYNLLHVCNN